MRRSKRPAPHAPAHPGTTALALMLMTAVTACGGGPAGSVASLSGRATTRSSYTPGLAGMTPGSAAVTARRSLALGRPPGQSPGQTCVGEAVANMSDAERVGQLFMVGVSGTGVSDAEARALRRADVGSIMLTGHSTAGVARTKALVDRLQGLLAVPELNIRSRLLVATDQEGGKVQALGGPGFSAIPSAVTQGSLPVATLRSRSAGWGRELRSADVNTNFAPVADTVPASLGAANAPIGALSREYGHTPSVVASHSTAFAEGMADAHVLATLKHFPGLGRVRGNTDFTANVTDNQTTRHDPYLQPFRSGMRAGAPLVMASLATYTRVDPKNIAAFSPTVLTGMLRGDLGFTGVIVSDDLGNAVAVRSVPPGERALRFIGAGGDLVLTDNPATVGPMTTAILRRLPNDAGLRTRVGDAVRHILAAKRRAGLLSCE